LSKEEKDTDGSYSIHLYRKPLNEIVIILKKFLIFVYCRGIDLEQKFIYFNPIS